jgi:FkbM family methyltransferase
VENYFHKAIKKEKTEIKTIVIVGAYHGYEIFTLLNIYPNCIVHAFEAVPKHYQRLTNYFNDNPRVKTYNKTISDCIEDINFYELGNGGEDLDLF